ncbi:ATP-binding protein [Arthrobacter agilis]|uniref:ATP-binding protein n=1 Tax=Arthrobacter agilis TaxID=37921 RepID=UPI0027881A3D|nr:ATP-binding protein [Arthrobacter agilis]MDQ0735824.1 signal transduction histidine kinase/phage shock protein PspC (stress-responsive transcriptional regulator) [Arthrobacter agilis]
MRPPLLRRSDGVIAGVCAGLAVHLGVSRSWVRVGMALLTLASGAGILLYAWLWIFVPTAADKAAEAGRKSGPAAFMDAVGTDAGRLGGSDGAAGPAPGRARTPASPGTAGLLDAESWRERTLSAGRREILFGTALLLAAAVLVVQLLGVQINWGFLVPIAVVATGAALAWAQLDEVRRATVMNRAGAGRFGGTLRLLAGIVLVVTGVLVALSSSGSWTLTVATLVAVLAVLAGVGLVLAPWGLKFWRDLERERAGRVRETERAEIAAHLHDSVLQTLALIQNRADSETDVLRLARAQERELRQWLFADPARDPGSLAERLRGMAGEIEDLYGHPVAVVAVGDAALGPAEDALAQAAREAMLNAAKHAGVAVSVYLEAGSDAVEVFVRDRGPGFDPAAVPPDRLGIRESIHSRMTRHGGSAALRSDADGTEVRLRLPSAVGRSA